MSDDTKGNGGPPDDQKPIDKVELLEKVDRYLG